MKKLFYETEEFLKEKVEKIESEILALTDDGRACCVSDDKGAYLAKLIEERKNAYCFLESVGNCQLRSLQEVDFSAPNHQSVPSFRSKCPLFSRSIFGGTLRGSGYVREGLHGVEAIPTDNK